MISKEDVADLQPGDVVELRDHAWGDQVVMRGTVDADKHWLCLGPFILRRGGSPSDVPTRSLTVVSRAPRPLYTNSDRTEVAPGDVARDEDGVVWLRDSHGQWGSVDSVTDDDRFFNWTTGPRPTLLVDGLTGQVAQS